MWSKAVMRRTVAVPGAADLAIPACDHSGVVALTADMPDRGAGMSVQRFRKTNRAAAPTVAAESRSGPTGAAAAPFAMADGGMRWTVVLDPGLMGMGPSTTSPPIISDNLPVHFVDAAG